MSQKKEIVLIYPHQLFKEHPALKKDRSIYIVEEPLFFTQYTFHYAKLVLHRASMKRYRTFLETQGYKVYYIERLQSTEDIVHHINEEYKTVHIADVVDDYLEKRLQKIFGSHIYIHDTPLFISSREDLDKYAQTTNSFLFEHFYRFQRKLHEILINNDGSPTGGRWNFDAENRKKLPKDIYIPPIHTTKENEYVHEARTYVETHFSYTGYTRTFTYPTSFEDAEKSFDDFLKHKLVSFGDYEDAISKDHNIIFHAQLTPYLNIGLISPQEIVKKTLAYAQEHDTPLNALEGFIRQVIGWREFMRYVYVQKGTVMRNGNIFNHTTKLPRAFWNAQTHIPPVDNTIECILESGYTHHIPRLMILSNFMLLTEHEPQSVYEWFMEMFIDSYDWVMVPNVYDMGLFADGGIFATKPYISSSNYILKMSNYQKGEWCDIWDSLYWMFIQKNKHILQNNHRMGFVYTNLAKKTDQQLHHSSKTREAYLLRLKEY